MERRTLKHLPYIQLLGSHANINQKIGLIQTSSKEQVKTLLEILANVLYANITISQIAKEKLKRYKNILKNIWVSSQTLEEKRHLLEKNLKPIVLLLKAAKPFFKDICEEFCKDGF